VDVYICANPADNRNKEKTSGPGSNERWTAYQSPLQSYPFSRWHLHLTDTSDFSQASTTGSSSGLSILTPSGSFSSNCASGSTSTGPGDARVPGNLFRSLKMVTLFKSFDPDRRICQFEIPGGGVCRDDKCEDLHIERELERWEPSDEDTAQFLFEALAASSRDSSPGRSTTDIKHALEETRTRKDMTDLGFEDRVFAALSILGV